MGQTPEAGIISAKLDITSHAQYIVIYLVFGIGHKYGSPIKVEICSSVVSYYYFMTNHLH